MNEDMSVYFSGQKLYGDDFSEEQIEEWFRDEEEGYANLGAKNKKTYKYVYHKLNNHHGYKYLRKKRIKNALGIGSAYGEELKPIATMIDYITILEPSDAFSGAHEIAGTPCRYVKPDSNGYMSFDRNSFDLITSFGVMHHVPNVTHVMKECYRCLKYSYIVYHCCIW